MRVYATNGCCYVTLMVIGVDTAWVELSLVGKGNATVVWSIDVLSHVGL
jgi:hypothetical protein